MLVIVLILDNKLCMCHNFEKMNVSFICANFTRFVIKSSWLAFMYTTVYITETLWDTLILDVLLFVVVVLNLFCCVGLTSNGLLVFLHRVFTRDPSRHLSFFVEPATVLHSCSDFPLHSVKVKKIYKCKHCNYYSGWKLHLKWHIETHAAKRVLTGRSVKPLHCVCTEPQLLGFSHFLCVKVEKIYKCKTVRL